MSEERRFHARVHVELSCAIVGPKGRHLGCIVDLSLGGARLEAPSALAEPGEWLSLELEREAHDEPMMLLGQVLRVENGTPTRYALRFEPGGDSRTLEALIAAQITASQDFLAASASAGGGERRDPRVARRLGISCATTEEFTAIMENLSRRGIGLVCDLLISAGSPVMIELGLGDERLELSGTVAHVGLTEDGQFHVGVRFNEPSLAQQEAIGGVMRRLAS